MLRQVVTTSSRLSVPLIRKGVFRPMSGTTTRKPGVVTPEELKSFISRAGEKLVVVDVRNPDSAIEPGDLKSIAVGPLPAPGVRPKAVLLTFDRESKSMPLPDDALDKDTPIITHCGGGGRGQKAKDVLEAAGFANVVNGAGPKDAELWGLYGAK